MNLPLTISELQKDLLGKKYSAIELLEGYLGRIKTLDSNLNSFITITDEYAYSQAKLVQKRLSDYSGDVFNNFPLLGVVVALKDLYLTKGIRTTAASKVLEDYVPDYSSTVVKRLEAAGCIVIGKTNCDAWAHGASGENSDFGPTRNPWNSEFVPGGSSSGSAVSVASQFAHIAMGTDTGGSIRQPASFCNVVGFKPTYGAVSRYGVVAMASSLDTMGHFAHTAEDAKRVFDVTKGPDGFDSTVAEGKVPTKIHKKVGVPKEYFIEGIDPQVEKAVRDAISVYKNMGYEVVEVSLPHTQYAISVYYIVMSAEVSSNLGRYDGIRYGRDRSAFGAEAKRRIMLGTYVLSAGYYDAFYLKALKVRSKIISDFEKVFEDVDAIIAPVSPTPAFKLGEKINDPLQMYLADVFTVAANIAGIPGISIPAGMTSSGLPLSFQLMGPRFSESNLFTMGEEYQRQTDWHTRLPNLT